jgi:hypothetical protein
MNEKKVTQEKEKKSIDNHERGGRTAEKHRETKATEKQQTVLSPIPSSLRGRGEAEDTSEG